MSIFGQLRRAAASGILLLAIMALAQGCSGEHTNPLPVEKMGATAGSDESMALDLDARGYLNGIFIPGNINVYGYNRYPVSYVGSWTLFNSNVREGYYMARSSSPGARIDVVGTMTRVIFDFWDYRLYKDPGEVSFWLDGTQVGKFSLARSSSSGQSIMDYMVYTGKTTTATVTMKIESGSAVITAYRFIFPPIKLH